VIWAKESFLIAQNTTYPFMMKSDVATEEYSSLVYESSKKRITLAGYRLANFVIDVFDPMKPYNFPSLDSIEKDLMNLVKENLGKLKSFSKIRQHLSSE
jgi:hypothetical protein